ncbi:MAG: membrane protein insertion efficiency factor YidD [Proteobacteria bacterium]|uniref:Putative membrane protein insertion efficiency factor n=1 Tax=Candidatus Enterousia avistercoris TaxID=2840788 RepID=A0A9D9DFU1_9PROT|nr:membrane protein insertion efficiency factor YidD [Candidatus Enterousia avistercoris]
MTNRQNQNNFITHIAIGLVRIYQSCISPFIGGRAACRFVPSCSEYTATAIKKYGAWRGTIMGMRRILRCRPGGGFGYDPVP